jgi:hypothetical protein
MKAMNRTSVVTGGLLVLMGSTCVARGDVMIGDTLSLTFQGSGPSKAVSWNFDGDSGTNSAGFLNWAGGVKTFCVQLEENIGGGQTVDFAVVSPEGLPDEPPLPGPMGAARSLVMQDLYSRYYDSTLAGTAYDAAAFQMVIWEISHEMSADSASANAIVAGLDFGGGDATFSSSAAVMGIAEGMLLGLGAGGFNSYSGLLGLTDPALQDQLIVVPGVGALAGLGGVAGIRRRRRRG